MTDDELAEIEKRARAARELLMSNPPRSAYPEAAARIAAEDVPRLIAEIRRLRAARVALHNAAVGMLEASRVGEKEFLIPPAQEPHLRALWEAIKLSLGD